MFFMPMILALAHILVICWTLTRLRLIHFVFPIAIGVAACIGIYFVCYLATAAALKRMIIKNGGII
jgi:hypothetical protein